tara:strand:+ start:510 stop:851 length:342 start_codon:yes stop_codon:yes gene_type:complete
MSRFASNSNTTKQYTRGGGDANTRRGQRKGTVMANFRPDVNQKITSSTKLREGARQFVATNRVKGGETPTCQGHVNVERGTLPPRFITHKSKQKQKQKNSSSIFLNSFHVFCL